MKISFDKTYFAVFVTLFLIEVAIAIFFKEGFIRHTVGDFLVVILLYCFFKSFLNTPKISTALVTLGIAYIVELLQLTDFLKHIGLENNKWAELVFGNSFSIQDLVAYSLGIVLTLCFEKSNLVKRYVRLTW